MTLKFNRILILIFIFIVLILADQTTTVGQTVSLTAYMPLISNDPSGWIGPYGGTIVAIAIDPTNPNVSYAGTFGAGVFKSIDGGYTWVSSSIGLANLYIYSLAIDPSHHTTIYAGSYRNQIYKSQDGGNSWTWSGAGIQDQAIVYSIAIDPYDPSTIYAATRGISNNGNPPWNGVLYRSQNAGQTWEAIFSNIGGPDLQDWIYSIAVNPNYHNQVYIAAHESGPFRSDTNGNSWYSIDAGIQDYSGRSIVVSPLPNFSSTLFYGVWHFDAIYKSINTGASWTLVNQGIPNTHVYSVVLDPQYINTIYLATFTNGIIKSMDGGNYWQNDGLSNDHIYSLVINPNETSHLLAGTAGNGLFRTNDAGTIWLRSDAGIQNTQVTSVIVSPSDSNTLYTSVYGAGVYQSTNQGDSWGEINSGLLDLNVLDLVMDPAHPWILYAMTNEAGLFKNDLSQGNGWLTVGSGLPLTSNQLPAFPADHPFATLDMQESFATSPETSPSSQLSYATLRTMVYAPSNQQIVYLATAGSGVYRSSDGAQSWQPAGLVNQNILALAVDLLNPNLVYAATATPGSLKISTNGGQNWADLTLGVSFYSLAASPVEAGVLYAGTNAGIYRYKSAGWKLLGLSDQLVSAITIDPTQPNSIYAGTYLGAYYSHDSGLSWTFVDNNLRDQIIQSIRTDPANPILVYFGTKAHGIFLAAIRY
jgi:photosystem II stability/assembly factor-like uncharacterized protein